MNVLKDEVFFSFDAFEALKNAGIIAPKSFHRWYDLGSSMLGSSEVGLRNENSQIKPATQLNFFGKLKCFWLKNHWLSPTENDPSSQPETLTAPALCSVKATTSVSLWHFILWAKGRRNEFLWHKKATHNFLKKEIFKRSLSSHFIVDCFYFLLFFGL